MNEHNQIDIIKQEKEIQEQERERISKIYFELNENNQKNQAVSFTYVLKNAPITIKIMAIPYKYEITHGVLKDYPKSIDNTIPLDVYDHNLENILNVNTLADIITNEIMDNLLPSAILVKVTRLLDDKQHTSAYSTLKLPNFKNTNLEAWLFDKI